MQGWNMNKKKYLIGVGGLLILIFLISFLISAEISDNKKFYDNKTKTLIIRDKHNELILNITRLTPQNNYVMRGKDRLVAVYVFSDFDKLKNDVFTKIDFYNFKKQKKKENRNYKWKYGKKIEYNLTKYKTTCDEEQIWNKENQTYVIVKSNCIQIPDGVITKTRIEWIEFTDLKEIRKNDLIGLFVDVLPNEHVEYVPTFFNVRVEEDAEWTESLNIGLVSYYQLNGTSGDVVDALGINNGTNTQTTRGALGIINNSFNFTAGLPRCQVSFGATPTFQSADKTVSLWIKPAAFNDWEYIIAKGNTDSYRTWSVTLGAAKRVRCLSRSNAGEYVIAESTSLIPSNSWTFASCIFNESGAHVYFNGTLESTTPCPDVCAFNESGDFYFGTHLGTEHYYVGLLDEVGIWNRSLSNNEITQLYNDGNGMTYSSITVPNVTLISPENNSWSSSTTTFVCNATDTVNLVNATLYIWNSTGIVNNTETNTIVGTKNSTNFTIILPRTDTYYWNCLVYNNASYFDWYESNWTLNVDIDYPQILIIYPINSTNYSNNQLNINYTISDANLGSCWYSNDTFNFNTTITCGENITSIVWSEGQHNVTVYANDSANNINSSSVTFVVDTISPTITIVEPKAQNYANNNSIELNYTITDSGLGVDSCWYMVINSTNDLIIDNTTLASCANTSFGLVSGDIDYTLTLYSNDTLNNLNSSSVTFGIRTTAPAIVLNYPDNNVWFDNGTDIYFNFTATDSDGLDTCELWSNWTGTWHNNYSWVLPESGVMNFTIQNISDISGAIWNIWCNDSLNNNVFSLNNYTLNIDTIYPNVSITSITTTVGSQTFTFDSIAQDTNNISCKYSIFDSDGNIDGLNENVSFNCNTETSATATALKSYNLTIYAKDLAGNENSSTKSFILSTAGPIAGPGGGGGAPIVIIEGNISWRMLTDTGGGSYELLMRKKSKRTKSIFFENLGLEDINLTISCKNIEGDLCRYTSLSKTNIFLPATREVFTEVYFILNLPEELDRNDYIFNIVATEKTGLETPLTVKVTISRFSFIIEFINKFGKVYYLDLTKWFPDAKPVPIPYVLIILSAMIIIFNAIYWPMKKSYNYAPLWSLSGSFLVSLIIMMFLP